MLLLIMLLSGVILIKNFFGTIKWSFQRGGRLSGGHSISDEIQLRRGVEECL